MKFNYKPLVAVLGKVVLVYAEVVGIHEVKAVLKALGMGEVMNMVGELAKATVD